MVKDKKKSNRNIFTLGNLRYNIIVSFLKVEMTQLVKVKGLKGKQNKKKWAKNIDISGLLQGRAKDHDAEIRQKFRVPLVVSDDNDKTRAPLDPNRFKQTSIPLPKKVYNNKITRDLGLKSVQDVWEAPDNMKHKYKPSEIPSVIAPETGHSYNPREGDIEKLIERVIDYESIKPCPKKEKAITQLPEITIRYRNKKKRASQLAQRRRIEDRQFRQQLHNFKKIKKQLDQRGVEIQEGLKTKMIKKKQLEDQEKTGRVRKGRKLGKKSYQFKEYIPQEEKVDKLSKVALSEQLFRQRFDTIYRRGIFQPRNIKVHANKRKGIKVKQRGFIE